jgi:hypothetical protein
MKMGEENTKYFHAMATKRFRRNTISYLVASNGRPVSSHEEIAGIAWNCYRHRMGSTRGINMKFDLSTLLHRVDGLVDLAAPFTVEEMDNVVKHMCIDKAPGADGFNGFFMKKC